MAHRRQIPELNNTQHNIKSYAEIVKRNTEDRRRDGEVRENRNKEKAKGMEERRDNRPIRERISQLEERMGRLEEEVRRMELVKKRAEENNYKFINIGYNKYIGNKENRRIEDTKIYETPRREMKPKQRNIFKET